MSAWNDTSAQPYALVSFPTHPLISLILPYVSRENSMFAQKPHVLSKKPHVFSKKPQVFLKNNIFFETTPCQPGPGPGLLKVELLRRLCLFEGGCDVPI